MKSRVGNLILGFLMLILSVYIFFDVERNVLPSTLLFALSIMFLSLGYLYPQFKKKDERMKLIRERGMYYTYFILMLYFFSFAVLLGLNIISLTAFAVVQILASLTIATYFMLMVILSKFF